MKKFTIDCKANSPFILIIRFFIQLTSPKLNISFRKIGMIKNFFYFFDDFNNSFRIGRSDSGFVVIFHATSQ